MLGLPTPTRKVQTAGWLLTGLAALALVPVQLVGRAQYADVPSPPAADLALEPPAAAPQVWQRSGREKDFSYAILYGENSMMMDGHDISSERLQRLRGNDARLFWFEIAGREYVVRDPAGIDRALAVTKVVRELGAAQGEVGSKQGAIGAQQGQVGAKQGAIGAQQGQIGAKQGAIGAKQAALAAKEVAATDAERRQLDRQQTELDAEMRKLDAEMRVLDQHMREADQPMADLDAKMRVLDDEMRVLDGKMHEAEKKMEVEMRQLIEKLIAEKVAQPL